MSGLPEPVRAPVVTPPGREFRADPDTPAFRRDFLDFGGFVARWLGVWSPKSTASAPAAQARRNGGHWEWYRKRLASMSPAEIPYRLGEQGRRAVSRRRNYGWEHFAGAAPVTPIPELRRQFLANASEALRERIRSSTAALLAGDIQIHGVAWPRAEPGVLFPPGVWSVDPVSGAHWPNADVYCFDIEYRGAAGFGDVKYVWDLNRLQFLQPLAAAVAASGDRAALAAIEAAIASWADANRPFGGVAWASGIELATRAISLVTAASLCGDALSAPCRKRIATILGAHLYWLRRFPSLHSSANNHLIAELVGELAIASALPREPDSAAIVERAAAALIREAERQILPDGVGAEQSPSYAAFTVELLLAADLIAAGRGVDIGGALRPKLGAFVDHIRWLADDAGRVPTIGDDDGGRVFTAFGTPERGYPASVARAAAARLGLGSPVAHGPEPPELRDALFGSPAPYAPSPSGVRAFASGGYTIVRERRAGRSLRLVMDHGPLGYLSIAAHGHADANAITLSLDGVDVFVDPGTYLYHSGGAWRNWFRSTRAHNTLALARQDQSAMSGPFNWSRKATARLLRVIDDAPDWLIEASHDGYLRRFGVIHARRARALACGVEILDTLSAPTEATAEVAFQLGPDLEIEGEGPRWTIRRAGGAAIVRVAFSAEGETSADAGGELGEGGWISPRFGVKAPAPRLQWRGVLPREGLRTTISWGSAPI